MLTAEETPDRVLGASPDRMARWGGVMMLLTAAITVVMVYARVASDADQATLLESLRSVAEHRGMYSLFSGARVVSGVTLAAGGLVPVADLDHPRPLGYRRCALPVRLVRVMHHRFRDLRCGNRVSRPIRPPFRQSMLPVWARWTTSAGFSEKRDLPPPDWRWSSRPGSSGASAGRCKEWPRRRPSLELSCN